MHVLCVHVYIMCVYMYTISKVDNNLADKKLERDRVSKRQENLLQEFWMNSYNIRQYCIFSTFLKRKKKSNIL